VSVTFRFRLIEGTPVLQHVRWVGCGRNGAGYRRVSDHEFQEDLGPGAAVDLRRPVLQGLAPDALEELAALEGAIDDDGDAVLRCQGQKALLCLPVDEVLGELDEVEGLAGEGLFQFAVSAAEGGGDADVADPAGRLHGLQGIQLHLPVQHVADL